jgi:hypothetical protein
MLGVADPSVARPTPFRLSLVAFLAIVILLSTMATPTQAAGYPVIMVPPTAFGLMKPITDRLTREGHQLLSFSELDYPQAVSDLAWKLAARVREVSNEHGKANIACYSIAVLACRFAMKWLGIADRVHRAVLFGGGDGAYSLCFLPFGLGGDGCAFHAVARSILIGDDTPGPAEYYFITSFPDTAPFPQESAAIPDGGVCYQYIPFDGFSHGQETFQPVYQDSVASAMNGICPGKFIDLPVT